MGGLGYDLEALNMRLFLFDVDGTLIKCGWQVRPLLRAAVEEVFGTAGDLDGYDFAGKTDPQIILDVLSDAGIGRAQIVERLDAVRRSYVTRLRLGLDADQMELLPGVVSLLERMQAQQDVCVGLLTGNWESGARIKLSRFDLNRFFQFGAFGGDGWSRRELPPVALERARRHAGRAFSAEQTVIIGDTPNDVACARAHQVPIVAVATGTCDMAGLRSAGADWVVPTLEDFESRVPLLL